MPMIHNIRPEVLDGAKALDAYKPDWFRYINLELLDLSNSEQCIIGQLRNAGALDDSYGFPFDDSDYRLGFNTRESVESYEALSDEWVTLIEGRE